MRPRLRVPVFLATLLLLAGASRAPVRSPAGSSDRYDLRPDGLWHISGRNGPTRIAEAGHFRFQVVHSGARTWVLYPRYTDTRTSLVLLSKTPDGHYAVQTVVENDDIFYANALMEARMTPSGQIMADLHVNPHVGVTVFIDPRTNHATCYVGCRVVMSNDGRHVAFTRGFPWTDETIYIDQRARRVVPYDTVDRLVWNGDKLEVKSSRHPKTTLFALSTP